MLVIRRILATAFIISSLFSFTSYAQTNEFKREWTKIFDNVYYRSQSQIDKMPSGQTDFRVFGFKDKKEYPANIKISGNVTDAAKENKVYRYTMDKADVEIEHGYDLWKFKGNMMLYVGDDVKDSVSLMIVPLDGNIKKGDVRSEDLVNYHIKPEWHEQVGSMTVNVGKPGKMDNTPPYTINYTNFMLPQHVTKPVEFTREISNSLQDKALPMCVDDSIFLHVVLEPDTRIKDVPGLEIVVSEMRMKSDPSRLFDSEVLYYKLGDVLNLSEAEIKRQGSDYSINYHGAEPKYRFKATYHLSAFPEFTKVEWNDGSKFEKDDLTRSDRSQITGIKFDVKANLLEMSPGYVISQLKALSDFNNLDFYDFSKYLNNKNLGKMEVGAYISPDKQSEMIEIYINPVRERVMAEHEEELKEAQRGQERYDRAKDWLNARQSQLAADYDIFKTGKEEFDLPNNQHSDPHNVKVIRYISRNSDNEYEETYKVDDRGQTYPLLLDDDGDLCYVVNGRTYWFTRISDKARNYIENCRLEKQYRAVVAEGRPKTPTFD